MQYGVRADLTDSQKEHVLQMPISSTKILLSSTEAEFASMADAGKAALYLRSLLSDMGFVQEFPTEIQT